MDFVDFEMFVCNDFQLNWLNILYFVTESTIRKLRFSLSPRTLVIELDGNGKKTAFLKGATEKYSCEILLFRNRF